MFRLLQVFIIGLVLCIASPSFAQQTAFGFTPSGNTQAMSVTGSSSSITLSSAPQTTILITNTGSNTAYITNTATATTSGTPIPAGTSIFFNFSPSSTISAITASSTTTLTVTKGSGSSALTGGGSGSGGGAATIADGADVAEGSTTDAAATAGSTGTLSAKLRLMTTQLNTLLGGIITTGTITAPASQYVAVNGGGATASPVAVIPTGANYETIAASQSSQAMGATGATGDYLSHCVLYPTSTSPGVLTVFDNTSTTTNNVITFPGGSSSLSNLAPVVFPVGAISVNGPWKVTTGANLLAVCYGKFT